MKFGPGRKPLFAALVCGAMMVLCWQSGKCHAQSERFDRPLQWPEEFSRFRPVEYVGTSVMALGLAVTQIALPPPENPYWRGDNPFDSGGRSLLAADSAGTRSAAGVTSDVLLVGLMTYPFVIDAAVVSWGIQASPDVAGQLAAINAQSFLFTYLVTSVTKSLAGRQRPFMDQCEQGETGQYDCQSESRNQSFLSGHTSMAFTGAGLTCAHHGNLPLYGSRAAARATCGTALAAAGSVGVLRVVADRHHATDVLAGAALGLASGFLLPTLFHYQGNLMGPFAGNIAPLASSEGIGLAYHRSF